MDNVLNRFRVDGLTAIISGGAGQIGMPLAKALMEAGARVIVFDNDTDLCGKARNELKALDNERGDALLTNITNEDNVKSSIKQVLQKSGSIDILINAAHYKGSAIKLDTKSSFFAKFEEYPLEAWNKVLMVNLTGMFLCCREAAKQMIAQKKGVIVNISSTYGLVSPDHRIYGDSGINSPIAYATSKAGILNFTRYLATYLAPHNIRVNSLTPGGVYNNQKDDFVNNYIARTPLARMATPKDYQAAILYLCSDASAYMTGSNLVVDGGWTAW